MRSDMKPAGFDPPRRPNRVWIFFIASTVLLVALIGFMYHASGFDAMKNLARPSGNWNSSYTLGSNEYEAGEMKFFLEELNGPSIGIKAQEYRPSAAERWTMSSKPTWVKPSGKKLCILSVDTRPFDQPGQIFGPRPMSWDEGDLVHGLSLAFLNHWLYAKIHGYEYYYITAFDPADRRSSWMKGPILADLLTMHDTCIIMDSDAMFKHLDVPFEWLMNYWEIDDKNTPIAIAEDPDLDRNHDPQGGIYLNTGFIVAQNDPRAFQVLEDWWNCPADPKHPNCKDFLYHTNGGFLSDQGAFGIIRYDHAADIKVLACTEANGYPQSEGNCDGSFISHFWTSKDDWLKRTVGDQLPGSWLELFHKQFTKEKPNFFMTQEQLRALPKTVSKSWW